MHLSHTNTPTYCALFLVQVKYEARDASTLLALFRGGESEGKMQESQ